jgi:hypothetical protein
VTGSKIRAGREAGYRACGSLVLGAAGAWAAREAWGLGLFQLGAPAPGLFPFIFGALLAATGAVSLVVDVVAVLRPGTLAPAASVDEEPGGALRVAGYLVVGTAWTLALSTLGFVLSTFLGLVLMMAVVEKMPWRISLGISAAAAAAAWLLFVRLLAVPLPATPF